MISLETVVGLLPAKVQPKAKALVATLLSVLTLLSLFEKWSWLTVALAVVTPAAVHQTPNLSGESKGSA